MSKLLTTKEVMEYFNVKDSRTISKFIRQGLKVIPIGQKDYRFKQEDVEEFAEHLSKNKVLKYAYVFVAAIFFKKIG